MSRLPLRWRCACIVAIPLLQLARAVLSWGIRGMVWSPGMRPDGVEIDVHLAERVCLEEVRR